jgi:hypothetical protein
MLNRKNTIIGWKEPFNKISFERGTRRGNLLLGLALSKCKKRTPPSPPENLSFPQETWHLVGSKELVLFYNRF